MLANANLTLILPSHLCVLWVSMVPGKLWKGYLFVLIPQMSHLQHVHGVSFSQCHLGLTPAPHDPAQDKRLQEMYGWMEKLHLVILF